MVSHCDHNEHSVQIIVTEQGYADLRGVSPEKRPELIIERCAHPDYRPALRDYLATAKAANIANDLAHAFDFHLRFRATGTMKP